MNNGGDLSAAGSGRGGEMVMLMAVVMVVVMVVVMTLLAVVEAVKC